MDLRVEFAAAAPNADDIIETLTFDPIPEKTIPLEEPFVFGIQTTSLGNLVILNFFMVYEIENATDFIRPTYEVTNQGLKMLFSFWFQETTAIKCQLVQSDTEIENEFILYFAPSGIMNREGVHCYNQTMKLTYKIENNQMPDDIAIVLSVDDRIGNRRIQASNRINGILTFDYNFRIIREYILYLLLQFGNSSVRHHQTFKNIVTTRATRPDN
ncbi:hypothetical protein GCK72_004604 [Caenorhabditis remanei]|uniref:Uncharacterized protein n=1 Tax=Caenorhabditis remanei TaxID=31234 RepID=A0A6A5HBM8_CAERE|nr:hypothetical protein GCK72_004604 [Caenorhabditis remanei]KAF1764655.1 hypothetical protein GCK72_004604 [Caenorhabditis remanei]